jgi:hypothetical protein
MANHWPPKRSPSESTSAGGRIPVAAGPGRTWALLAGSEARDSLFDCEPLRRWLPYLIAVRMPFAILFIIIGLTFGQMRLVPIYGSLLWQSFCNP